MPMIEVAPRVWLTLRVATVALEVDDEPIEIRYQDIPAASRALSIVKESKQYAAWLKREGLA